MSTSHRFPFGRPVAACKPSSTERSRLFVLGAYPSALHVRWTPPASTGLKPIQAIAVDNEPVPFWSGDGETERIADWTKAVGFDPGRHGKVEPVGRLNGSSGQWVEKEILGVLRVPRMDAWITDCLDTYRCSVGLEERLNDTYTPFATQVDLPAWSLVGHPSEDEIVREALRDHESRLRGEMAVAMPEVVVTLGNAALRVLGKLIDIPAGGAVPAKLASDTNAYGKPIAIRVGGVAATWLPLAHPAAPKAYQEAHAIWHANRRDA